MSESHTDLSSICLKDSGGRRKFAFVERNKEKSSNPNNNIWTMRLYENQEGLEQELEHIKWFIIGISETRLQGQKFTTLKSNPLTPVWSGTVN